MILSLVLSRSSKDDRIISDRTLRHRLEGSFDELEVCSRERTPVHAFEDVFENTLIILMTNIQKSGIHDPSPTQARELVSCT